MSSATGPSSPVLPAVAKVVKAKKVAAAKKTSRAPSSHPSWKKMIIECIAANPDDARQGVSRSTIKKYAEEQYKLDTSGSNLYQLNRAIANGVEKGAFVLPKGPSGKVKLSPKAKIVATKENFKPPSKKPTAKKLADTKKVVTKTAIKKLATKAVSTKTKNDTKKAAAKKAATKPKGKADSK